MQTTSHSRPDPISAEGRGAHTTLDSSTSGEFHTPCQLEHFYRSTCAFPTPFHWTQTQTATSVEGTFVRHTLGSSAKCHCSSLCQYMMRLHALLSSW